MMHVTDDDRERIILFDGFSMKMCQEQTSIGEGIVFTTYPEYAFACAVERISKGSAAVILSWVVVGPRYAAQGVGDQGLSVKYASLYNGVADGGKSANSDWVVTGRPELCMPFAVVELATWTATDANGSVTELSPELQTALEQGREKPLRPVKWQDYTANLKKMQLFSPRRAPLTLARKASNTKSESVHVATTATTPSSQPPLPASVQTTPDNMQMAANDAPNSLQVVPHIVEPNIANSNTESDSLHAAATIETPTSQLSLPRSVQTASDSKKDKKTKPRRPSLDCSLGQNGVKCVDVLKDMDVFGDSHSHVPIPGGAAFEQ